MKQFVTPPNEGGLPIFNTDLVDIVQHGYLDVLKGQFTQMRYNNREGAVISGCEVTDAGGGNFNVATGVVFLNGEFLTLDATNSVPNPSYIVEHTDTLEARTFKDGASKNVIRNKRAKIQASKSAQYFTINRVTDNHYKWYAVSDLITLENGWSEDASNKLMIKKTLDGTVWCTGELTYATGTVTSERPFNDNLLLADFSPSKGSGGFTTSAHSNAKYTFASDAPIYFFADFLRNSGDDSLGLRITNILGKTDATAEVIINASYQTSDLL